jgi:benzoylformate decarboxylase
MTGIGAFLEILAGAGVSHIFGNPGTTELPLNDALGRDSRFRYFLGLHEIPVTAAADGYAQASGKVGVVNLHTACGLGNAMGMLYNAHAAGTPLLVTAGHQDTRLRFDEAVLTGPLVEMARPLVKWAAEVHRVEDLPNATRRAIQVALTPPTGPVFLALPLDVQMASAGGLDLSPPWLPDRHIRPAREPLQQAAQLLAPATSPVILAGSRVTESGAVRELVSLAETLGAVVFSESGTAHGRMPFPTDHPLYGGPLPLWSPDVRGQLAGFDVAFAVGMSLLKLYIHKEPARPLPESLKLIHLDSAPAEIGKNFPIEVGLVGDPKAGLAELVWEIDRRLGSEQITVAGERVKRHAARREKEQAALRAKIEEHHPARPMSPYALMGALAEVLPPNVAVVEEAPTAHHNIFERLGALRDPAGFFAHRGWALGWGIGCALGVKLAWPDRPVLALIGDGAALYGIQGLCTAARYNIPVTVVICNNARYKILQVCGDVLDLPGITDATAPGVVLDQPAVDFIALARSLGVDAHRVTEPDELAECVRASFTSNRPVLFDVPISD